MLVSKRVFIQLNVVMWLVLIGFVIYVVVKHKNVMNQFEIVPIKEARYGFRGDRNAKMEEDLVRYTLPGNDEVKLTPLEINLKILNIMGHPWTRIDLLRLHLEHREFSASLGILTRMQREAVAIQEKLEQKYLRLPSLEKISTRAEIIIAFTACGSRSRNHAKNLVKSILIFSLDAKLHLIVFSDSDTILEIGQDILTHKWTMNAMGHDFTYELHLTWFPGGDSPRWKSFYAPCATQRLFFPSLLGHIDSLLYLDTDVIVVSNLTILWEELRQNMADTKMVGVTPNTEDDQGMYSSGSNIPFYGNTGVNAGVMLMNLTQLRTFGFEERALAAYKLYHEKIRLADQDIINIIFHGFPEKLLLLSCSYNFYWVHCNSLRPMCTGQNGENACFCSDAQTGGIKIVHGNARTFTGLFDRQAFLSRLKSAFDGMNLLRDLRPSFFSDLKEEFRGLSPPPCPPLSADIMYDNGQVYLQDLQLQFVPASQFLKFLPTASTPKSSVTTNVIDNISSSEDTGL